MARMYFGKTLMSPHTVDEKEVAKTKFGVSIDDLLGDVDENGAYTPPPKEPSFVFDLTGVTSLPENGSFEYFYYGGNTPSIVSTQALNRRKLVGVVANDLVKITKSNSFHGFATYAPSLKYVQFDGLEECYGLATFSNAFSEAAQASFKKLRIVNAQSAFQRAFSTQNTKPKMDMDAVFPSLEIIGGQTAFDNIVYSSSTEGAELRFSKIHTIYGPDTIFTMYALFGGAPGYFDICLPRCATIEYRVASSNSVLHFAAANQSAIEACAGYDYKFGAKEIYFDLMLIITVDGIVYDREYTIAGYTSWKDANGNLVYTDATAEPVVGTVVYSDQGTTQVGTVEAVA